MKKTFFLLMITFFVFSPIFEAQAQSSSGPSQGIFDTTDFPQWAKDLRRSDIIAFGTFPFTLFATVFFTDLHRWNAANGLDFSEEGRRYAPWPLKSAGSYDMSKEEFERSLLIAAGVSITLAIVDFIIVKIKEQKERRRIESRPAGSIILDLNPYGLPEDNKQDLELPDDIFTNLFRDFDFK